jgi:hypothetical protein
VARRRRGLEFADAVIALSREQSFPSWLAAGVFCRGSALAMQGEQQEGIAQMLEGSSAYRSLGAQTYRTGFLYSLIKVYIKSGRTEEAAKVLMARCHGSCTITRGAGPP